MNKKFLYFLAAGHLSVDINSGSLPAVLPFFVTEYGMDYTAIAGLMFASSFLSSVIQPIFGWLADRGSRQWFMGLGILMSGLSMALTGFLSDYWAIFAAVTMMGIGGAIFHPEAARMVNAVSGENRGQGMSIFSVGGNGGFGFGPLLAVFLLSTFGMKGTAFYGITSLIMGLTMLVLAPRIRAAAEEDKRTAGAESKEAGTNDWSAFSKLTLVILFRSTVFTSISSFLPLYCIMILGTSHAVGSATLSIISISGVFATLVGGWFSDRKGYVKTLRYGCCLLVPCLAVAVFSGHIWAVYAMLIPMSFAMQGPYAAFVVLGQSYLAKSIGFASGITLGLSFSVGGIIVPVLGKYADTYGIYSVMVLVVIISAAAAASTFLLPKPKNTCK